MLRTLLLSPILALLVACGGGAEPTSSVSGAPEARIKLCYPALSECSARGNQDYPYLFGIVGRSDIVVQTNTSNIAEVKELVWDIMDIDSLQMFPIVYVKPVSHL
jgi:hypothetical protein